MPWERGDIPSIPGGLKGRGKPLATFQAARIVTCLNPGHRPAASALGYALAARWAGNPASASRRSWRRARKPGPTGSPVLRRRASMRRRRPPRRMFYEIPGHPGQPGRGSPARTPPLSWRARETGLGSTAPSLCWKASRSVAIGSTAPRSTPPVAGGRLRPPPLRYARNPAPALPSPAGSVSRRMSGHTEPSP
jgi:hypothetical protein